MSGVYNNVSAFLKKDGVASSFIEYRGYYGSRDSAGYSERPERRSKQIKRYAVVVGINDYSEAGMGSLSYCVADAEAFYDALLTYCEYDPACITLFSDGQHKAAQRPNRSNILDAVATMADQATTDDSVLFFFAGHGDRNAQDSYLLTPEYRASVMAETSIPMGLVNNYMQQSKARFVMRFFDACHSGRIGARAPVAGPDVKKHLLVEAEGWATLAACKEDQYAHEDPDLGHGIFSYCLIKGLSGEAATSKGEVTIDSLTTYTIDNTIDITKDLGLQQTPVRKGSHAGELILATVRSARSDQIPAVLVKVQETTIEQLRPTPEKIPQFVQDIRTILQEKPLSLDYVASSHTEKLTRGADLVEKVYGWCQEQEREYHEQLQGLVTVTVKRLSIQACPCNLKLAEYIQESKIKQAVALQSTYKNERVESNHWLDPFGYQTKKVLSGITELEGYFTSAVLLTVEPQTAPLMPACAMVIAIIPASFGLYLLRYSCSTLLHSTQREQWDPSTFVVRTLRAIPVADTEGVKILQELQDLYPQFISLFIESCSARHTYLQKIGISGQSLL